jgi:uncharacterized membrane protein YhaH (DUF805 family)
MATEMQMTRSRITVGRHTLLYSLIVSVALFVVAAPLGDSTHGIGAHHPVVADIGNAVFAVFLLSVLVLVALMAVFLVQTLLGARRHRAAG